MLNNLSKSKIFMCETISTDFIVCPSVCPYVPYDRKLADGLSLLEVLISYALKISHNNVPDWMCISFASAWWLVCRATGWLVGWLVRCCVGRSVIIFILLSRSYSKPFLVPIWGENLKKENNKTCLLLTKRAIEKKIGIFSSPWWELLVVLVRPDGA